jgi:hypothetical protein
MPAFFLLVLGAPTRPGTQEMMTLRDTRLSERELTPRKPRTIHLSGLKTAPQPPLPRLPGRAAAPRSSSTHDVPEVMDITGCTFFERFRRHAIISQSN